VVGNYLKWDRYAEELLLSSEGRNLRIQQAHVEMAVYYRSQDTNSNGLHE
jgi:hypothetical protein